MLIVLITVWAVIFYFAMLDEVYDSLDDGLENQKELIIQAAETNPSLLNDTDFGVNNYTITKTTLEKHGAFSDTYRDTLMYMQNEDEYESVRILESVFAHGGEYYKIMLITSMVEEDDQIENLFTYLIGLYLVLLVSILLLNNLVLRKVWRPFYTLIDTLKGFRIERDAPIMAESTKIDEFELLNQSVETLTKKSKESYVAQKEFIENASHELQTPLAIGINKLELLLEKSSLTADQSQEVGAVLENLGRLTRMNRSLLLLSKIDNQQFVGIEGIDFNRILAHIAESFEDFAEHRNIRLKIVETGTLKFPMNKDLASILIINLIKNAIVHGEQGKEIEMEITNLEITVRNYGSEGGLDASKIFKRFNKYAPGKQSTGLGLAISKAIADKYGLKLGYRFSDRHMFTLRFPTE